MTRRTRIALALGLGLLLLLPALLNGSILLYPDSIGYFHAGRSALDAAVRLLGLAGPGDTTGVLGAPRAADPSGDGVSTARSVYYGMPFVLLFRLGGAWALVVVQAVFVVVAIDRALPRLVAGGAGRLALVGAGLATLTGLGLFVGTAMPDVFTGLMLLALAMLLAPWRLSRADLLWWLFVLLVGGLVHKANLATAVAVVGLAIMVRLLRRGDGARLPAICGVLAIAIAGHLVVGLAVTRVAGRPAVDAPFLLARTVGDGTAKLYLDRHCPDPELALCRFRDRLPMTENDFLWSHDPAIGLLSAVSLADRIAITGQANRVVLGVVTEFPLVQARISASNFLRQLFTVGVTEYALGPLADPAQTPALADLMRRYPATPAGQHTLPFARISAVMLAAYVASLGMLVVTLVALRQRGGPVAPRLVAIGWIVAGVVVNAAVAGILAGVFDRYQGRVAWLLPLAAISAVALWREARATAAP